MCGETIDLLARISAYLPAQPIPWSGLQRASAVKQGHRSPRMSPFRVLISIDGRRLKVVANGMPIWQRLEDAVDTTNCQSLAPRRRIQTRG